MQKIWVKNTIYAPSPCFMQDRLNKFNWFGLIFDFKFIKTIISDYSQLAKAYIDTHMNN